MELVCPKWQVVKENGWKSPVYTDQGDADRINQKVKGDVVPIY